MIVHMSPLSISLSKPWSGHVLVTRRDTNLGVGQKMATKGVVVGTMTCFDARYSNIKDTLRPVLVFHPLLAAF